MLAVNGAEKDFEEQHEVKISYVICSTPRSGSTLLCRGLWDTGRAGAPHEYFHENKHMPQIISRWKPRSFNDYLSNLLRFRTSSNGVFGFKAHFDQFKYLSENTTLDDTFPDLKYIRIRSRKLT